MKIRRVLLTILFVPLAVLANGHAQAAASAASASQAAAAGNPAASTAAADSSKALKNDKQSDSASAAEEEIKRRSTEAADRLALTIIGGTVVAVVGLFIRREMDIFELHNLSKILAHQLKLTLDDAAPIDVVVPISVDDFKPLARYLGADDFIVLMQTAAIVSRRSELGHELVTTPDKPDDEKYLRIDTAMAVLRESLRRLKATHTGKFRLFAVTHAELELW